MSTTASARQRPDPPEVEPHEYSTFIGQIHLQSVWLSRAEVINHAGPNPPPQATFGIRDKSRWEASDDGFVAFQTYFIQVTADDKTVMEMTVEYGLAYASATPMTDAIFALFRGVNLPLNNWPYLRQYVADTLGRMNWTPFTLPVFRVNTPPPAQGRSAATPPRKRSARKSKAPETESE